MTFVFTYLYNDFFQEFRRIDKVPQNEVSTEKHQITGEDMAQSKNSLLGFDSLWGDCTFIPADWGS